MRYGSVCSGIEAATMAWHPLGWQPAFFSDIEDFPRAALQHHYPDVPLHGDFTTIGADQYGAIDLLVGGTPCQSFSIAGLRGGMDDDRGNLSLEFLRLAERKAAKWLVWENVPGVLSSNGGRDFGSFLGALVELGYGFAYRTLDAQYFGVPQRRKRVFVVGYLGDWRRSAAVLFERQGLCGDSPPRREEGQKVAPAVTTGPPFSRTGNERVEADAMVPVFPTLDASMDAKYGCNQWVDSKQYVLEPIAKTLCAHGQRFDSETENFVAFHPTQTPINSHDVFHTLGAGASASAGVADSGLRVRRITPIECERLQGFPDGFTQIPYRGKPADKCPDGPRYRALGNSMAVPVMRWIGERIQQVESL